MKDKVITIKPKGITQKQWSILLLELNLIRKAWKPFGVDMQMSAPGLKRILDWCTKRYGTESTEQMDIIVLNDGMYQLLPVSKQILDGIVLTSEISCFDLCDILRLKLSGYVDTLNLHIMNDGSGSFIGCMCRQNLLR